jgi:hypothetical protein
MRDALIAGADIAALRRNLGTDMPAARALPGLAQLALAADAHASNPQGFQSATGGISGLTDEDWSAVLENRQSAPTDPRILAHLALQRPVAARRPEDMDYPGDLDDAVALACYLPTDSHDDWRAECARVLKQYLARLDRESDLRAGWDKTPSSDKKRVRRACKALDIGISDATLARALGLPHVPQGDAQKPIPDPQPAPDSQAADPNTGGGGPVPNQIGAPPPYTPAEPFDFVWGQLRKSLLPIVMPDWWPHRRPAIVPIVENSVRHALRTPENQKRKSVPEIEAELERSFNKYGYAHGRSRSVYDAYEQGRPTENSKPGAPGGEARRGLGEALQAYEEFIKKKTRSEPSYAIDTDQQDRDRRNYAALACLMIEQAIQEVGLEAVPGELFEPFESGAKYLDGYPDLKPIQPFIEDFVRDARAALSNSVLDPTVEKILGKRVADSNKNGRAPINILGFVYRDQMTCSTKEAWARLNNPEGAKTAWPRGLLIGCAAGAVTLLQTTGSLAAAGPSASALIGGIGAIGAVLSVRGLMKGRWLSGTAGLLTSAAAGLTAAVGLGAVSPDLIPNVTTHLSVLAPAAGTAAANFVPALYAAAAAAGAGAYAFVVRNKGTATALATGLLSLPFLGPAPAIAIGAAGGVVGPRASALAASFVALLAPLASALGISSAAGAASAAAKVGTVGAWWAVPYMALSGLVGLKFHRIGRVMSAPIRFLATGNIINPFSGRDQKAFRSTGPLYGVPGLVGAALSKKAGGSVANSIVGAALWTAVASTHVGPMVATGLDMAEKWPSNWGDSDLIETSSMFREFSAVTHGWAGDAPGLTLAPSVWNQTTPDDWPKASWVQTPEQKAQAHEARQEALDAQERARLKQKIEARRADGTLNTVNLGVIRPDESGTASAFERSAGGEDAGEDCVLCAVPDARPAGSSDSGSGTGSDGGTGTDDDKDGCVLCAFPD